MSEERSLQRFCQEICDQVSGWTVGNFYDVSANEVMCPEVANADVSCHFLVGLTIIDEFDGNHIILIYTHRNVRACNLGQRAGNLRKYLVGDLSPQRQVQLGRRR